MTKYLILSGLLLVLCSICCSKDEPQTQQQGGQPVQLSIWHRPVYIITTRLGPPSWEYKMWVYEKNTIYLTPGSTWSISGEGITSASVTGDAALDKFGAWRVKEVKPHYVMFEATKEAWIYGESIHGFSITAPGATVQKAVNWLAGTGPMRGCSSGQAWGPAKKQIIDTDLLKYLILLILLLL